MKVWDRNGDAVDNDTFTAGQDHNLGTPDGSGDIPRGIRGPASSSLLEPTEHPRSPASPEPIPLAVTW